MYEESTIINPPTSDDIEIISIPANKEAQKLEKTGCQYDYDRSFF